MAKFNSFIRLQSFGEMHLNSNDIFNQIGLVVSNQESSEQNVHFYTVFLQIELSEGKDELLQIRNYDDPHEVSYDFCRKHKLNELAVQIVENKIIEAKQKQELRIRESLNNKSKESISQTSFNRSGVSSRYRNTSKLKESLNKDKYLSKESQKRSLISSIRSINKSNNKSQLKEPGTLKKQKESTSKNKQSKKSNQKGQSKNKSKSKNKQANKKNKVSPQKQKAKKPNPNIGNELYARAMMRYKNQQNERQKRKEQQLKKESQELTFQPKINAVSSKIVQFRKQNGQQTDKQKEKQNKRTAFNQQRINEEANEIKQCTFKPQINRVSQLISQNRNVYKDQFDHFTALYKQAGLKKDRLNAKPDQGPETLFQPKINLKSSQSIKETFEQRLERSIIRKKVQKQASLPDEEYPFQPKIGRPPKNGKRINKSESTNSWWNQLHSQKLKTTEIPSQNGQQTHNPIVSNNSNIYFENLIQKRTADIFKALDSDQDGLISPDSIAIERLTKNQLIFLKPLFEEMDELEAYLDFTQFRKALNMLLIDADVHSRGQFLSEKPKKQERASFTPEINKKSKQMAMTRMVPGVEVFDQLYQKGLKELQKRQYQHQKIREHQEELQMEECSFKPLLNNTSKYYIDKVLGKKISKFDQNQSEN